MSRADDGLRSLLHRNLKNGFDWTVVETGGTVAGVPDSYWAHADSRTSGWVECKATTGWALDLRPHQVGWIARHVRAGVRVVVAVRARGVGSASGRGDSLWLLDGAGVRELDEVGLRCRPALVLGRWCGEPRLWDWLAVRKILVGSTDPLPPSAA